MTTITIYWRRLHRELVETVGQFATIVIGACLARAIWDQNVEAVVMVVIAFALIRLRTEYVFRLTAKQTAALIVDMVPQVRAAQDRKRVQS